MSALGGACRARPRARGNVVGVNGVGRRVTGRPRGCARSSAALGVATQEEGEVRRADREDSLRSTLGATGACPVSLLPDVMRVRDASMRRAQEQDGGSAAAVATYGETAAVAEGVAVWRASMERGEPPPLDKLSWPPTPLREFAAAALTRSGAQRLAHQHPALRDAILKDVLGMHLRLENALRRDAARKRPTAKGVGDRAGVRDEEEEEEEEEEDDDNSDFGDSDEEDEEDEDELDEATAAALRFVRRHQHTAAARQPAKDEGGGGDDAEADDVVVDDGDATAPSASLLTYVPSYADRDTLALCDRLARQMMARWAPALAALDAAGRAFGGLEALLGTQEGEAFDPSAESWRRDGWTALDGYRRQLEDCAELRALVRSLGRGAGWGPLRRSPVQTFDEKARLGLLRTVFEQQETRGLCRSDDLARMLPSEAALMARGKTHRESELLFFARLAERNLMSYERDGWSEQPASVPDPYRREVRPTAERGPILLCVDSSGSMRGVREQVAKAIALECMRQARVQERNCYAFAFAGEDEVVELELNHDPKSLSSLLGFLERTFNGGTDFNVPLKRCLGRLHDARWANSDIMLVTDGELHPPEPEAMRQLEGAKSDLGLRVHGLALPMTRVIGHADALEAKLEMHVLRALSTNRARTGRGVTDEVNLHLFEGWDAFEEDVFGAEEAALAASVAAGKLADVWREEEVKRRRAEERARKKKEKA